MRAVARGLENIGICGGVGAMVGLIGWATVTLVAAPNAYADAAWLLAAVSLVVGVVSGIGLALGDAARRGGRGGLGRRAAVFGGVAVAVLGLATGGFCASLARTASGALPVFGALAGCALVVGFVVGSRGERSGLRGSLVGVWLGVQCGVAFAAGYGLEAALAYSPPCVPHRYCLDFGRWSTLQAVLPAAALAGLALGITMWLALSACLLRAGTR